MTANSWPCFPCAHRNEPATVHAGGQPTAAWAEAGISGPPVGQLFDQFPIAGIPDRGQSGPMVNGDHPATAGTHRDGADVGTGVNANRLAWPVDVQDPAACIGLLGAHRSSTGDDDSAIAALA